MAIQIQRSAYRAHGHFDFRKLPEASGQTFKAGEFFKLVSGKVTVLATDEATRFDGQVLEDASETVDTLILCALPRVGASFISSVYHSTEASAITAITQRGTRYGLKVVSNRHYLDIEDTSNKIFLLKDIILPVGHAIGDVYGLVEFEVLDEVLALSGRDNA
jgi:hypothetical protein